MRRHRRLGQPGGPAAVLEERHVLRPDLKCRPLTAIVPAEHILQPQVAFCQGHTMAALLLLQQREQGPHQARQILLDIGHHQPPQAGLGLDALDQVVEVAHHQHDLDAGVVQLVLDLARRIQRVGGDDDAAGLEDGVEGHHELRRVRHEDPYRVALLYPEGRQAGRQAIGQLVHFGVGHDVAFEDRAGAAPVGSGGGFQEMMERDGRHVDMVGNAGVVALQPGPIVHVASPSRRAEGISSFYIHRKRRPTKRQCYNSPLPGRRSAAGLAPHSRPARRGFGIKDRS